MKPKLLVLISILVCLLAFNIFTRPTVAPKPDNQPIIVDGPQVVQNIQNDPTDPDMPEDPELSENDGEIKPGSFEPNNSTTIDTPIDPSEELIDYNGIYDSKDDVALYIYTYGELPSNYMTKKEARELGWSGGSLEDYAPGKCIGGDYFGNYEGILPEEHEYHECDIGTLGKKSRGSKRIIYSEDGLIYYTKDHYESFTLLYGEE